MKRNKQSCVVLQGNHKPLTKETQLWVKLISIIDTGINTTNSV